MKKVSIKNRTSGLMFAALLGGAILFTGCGGSSIGKQAAEDLCECSKTEGFAALACLGAWTEKYEQYLIDPEIIFRASDNESIFKDKTIQKDFEKVANKCKQ